MTGQGTHSSLSSGELAALAKVSRDTLRYYERQGLLAAAQRADNGYRRYPPEALARVRLIRGAMGIGFTIGELREILSARDRHPQGAVAAPVRRQRPVDEGPEGARLAVVRISQPSPCVVRREHQPSCMLEHEVRSASVQRRAQHPDQEPARPAR